MRKITLNLDRLSVESFPTTELPEAMRGTVDAAMMLRTRGDSCRTSCAGGGGDPMCTCPPPP